MRNKKSKPSQSQKNKLEYYCKQNEAYSQMLWKMIKQSKVQESKSKNISYTELFKLLNSFNQSLKKEVSGLQQQNKDKIQALSHLKQRIPNTPIPTILSHITQKEQQLQSLHQRMSILKQQTNQQEYQNQLQLKNNQLQVMITEKEKDLIGLKNKLGKLVEEVGIEQHRLGEVRGRVIADQIRLREVEREFKRIAPK